MGWVRVRITVGARVGPRFVATIWVRVGAKEGVIVARVGVRVEIRFGGWDWLLFGEGLQVGLVIGLGLGMGLVIGLGLRLGLWVGLGQGLGLGLELGLGLGLGIGLVLGWF